MAKVSCIGQRRGKTSLQKQEEEKEEGRKRLQQLLNVPDQLMHHISVVNC